MKRDFIIIGLHSFHPRSGKSTIGAGLAKAYHGSVSPIADGIREVARTAGLHAAANAAGDYKDVPMAALQGKTPRAVLIEVGNAFRTLYGEDFWIRKLLADARNRVGPGGVLIIDDVRLEIEAKAIEDAGGKVITISRFGVAAIPDINTVRPRCTVVNNATIAACVEAIGDLVLPGVQRVPDVSYG